MISNIDKHRFEYIWHLFYTDKTDKDLPFHEHKQCDPTIWQFPKALVEYHRLVFELGHKSFKDKTVLDIGCGMAWYLGCLENIAKNYTGIDPNVKSIEYAEIMSRIVNIDTNISVGKAESIEYKADTIMMLGVTQHVPDVKRIFEKFNCDNIILDSWEKLHGIHLNDLIIYFESKGFLLNEKHQWDDSIKDESWRDLGNRYILHFNRQAKEISCKS